MLLSAGIDASLAGVLGLLVGSFLNVVIYRLPKMMEQQWAADCAAHSGLTASPAAETFNLMVPRSRCQNCGHAIRFYENIPVLSYLVLRGQCSSCHSPISPRYPLVELATGVLFFLIVQRSGWGATGLAGCALAATLLTLALIDWDTTLLPDDLTLPLLWCGLIAAELQWNHSTLQASLWGAVAGYLSLWLIYQLFKWITGKEGMGFGDFKLFAALGAWFGWQALVPIILMASLVGTLFGLVLKFSAGLRAGGVLPFGPFLAGAGLLVLLWGPTELWPGL